uniref:Deoxynucleoside triphosphate triphosphohydrolase SAMHD1 homolog n=1 Tax=Rhizophora mucronata TaxID=61149 RepID=A0A2P2IPZ0_RHIMU
MAAPYAGEVLPAYHYPDRRYCKTVLDNVHGYISLDPLCLRFIDTEEFQRLRDLKQLGLTYMVFPGAVHSRFEHSLGVHWLAGEAIQRIRAHQGEELGIEDLDVKSVKLAGLLHDVGHGPFSHLFERDFLPRVCNGYEWSHEDMSVRMIEYMVDLHHIDIDSECLKKTKEMITASTEHSPQKIADKKSFLYDIVANGRNGVDVDKFDYLVRDSKACGMGCNFQFERLMDTMRVMGEEICYRAKEYLTVHKLFATRADMHRTVYTHPKVKAINLMVVDALSKANGPLGISSSIDDPAEFWKLDDSILKSIETAHDPDLREARDLILRIRRRDLYKYCNEFAVPKEKLEHFKEVTPQDIICSQNTGGVTLKEEDIAVVNVKIDFTHGKENPLQRVKFFKDYESDEKFIIPDHRISQLLPVFYEDKLVRVYSKKPELVEAVSAAFENFQVKTYGEKTQVHETPDSKKRKTCRSLKFFY